MSSNQDSDQISYLELDSDQHVSEHVVPDQVSSDQVASVQNVSEYVVSDQVSSDQVDCDQVASDQVTSIQAASVQVASDLGSTIQAPSNQAAYLTAKLSDPLMVGTAPYTPPGPHQIIIKNAAVAVNSVEWTKQLMGDKILSWIKYPFVLGNDCAGEVVQVGDKVSTIKVGDRVLAHALSMDPAVNKSSEGAFQHYTVIHDHMVTEIPEWLSYEEACVIPLGISTAATALFHSDFFSLTPPGVLVRTTVNSPPKAVLVWGGSSSVGCNAIQLAALAGYEVITTCSPQNFEYVTTLGASAVFDYRNELTIPQIIKILKTKRVVGAIAIGKGSTEACIKILAKTNGPKFVAHAGFPYPERIPTTRFQFFRTMASLKWSNIKIFIKSKRYGVKAKPICGSSAGHTEIGSMMYREFLPEALAGGSFVAAPQPRIVGKGLEKIQRAMDCHMTGVSAQKVVVSL